MLRTLYIEIDISSFEDRTDFERILDEQEIRYKVVQSDNLQVVYQITILTVTAKDTIKGLIEVVSQTKDTMKPRIIPKNTVVESY